MFDIVLVSIPYILPSLPPAAPAALKGHLKSRGFNATTRDFNIRILKILQDHPLRGLLPDYWINKNVELDPEYRPLYDRILMDLTQELLDLDARWIGISVFSGHSQRFCRELLDNLNRYRTPHTRLMIGGRGIEHGFVDTVRDKIDCYIMGDGELPLENLLSGNLDFPGINGPGTQAPSMDSLGTPDYQDYVDLDRYEHYYDSPAIQLTSSRGCIRRCSFCNVPAIWPEYQIRSGELVAQDIVNLYETTGVKHYFFTDSLINGNIKQLMKMMSGLADYRTRTGAPITWGGQWISRKQKGLPADYYQLLKASGGDNITIGVETGSDAVRAHMKKGFTTADLDAEMEQFSRHGIRCGFFMMVGYPTETRQDFFQTLDLFKRYTKYVADGTLVGVTVGEGFFPTPDAPIMQQKEKVFRIESTDVAWTSTVAEVDYIESMHRRIVTQQVIENLRWPANAVYYELIPLLSKLQQAGLTHAEKKWEDIDIDALLPSYQLPEDPLPTVIRAEMTASWCGQWPVIDIISNGHTVFEDLEVQGKMCVEFALPMMRKKNILKFRLKNKTTNNTRVDENGTILEDMSVIIDSICFGDVRQRRDDLYLQSSFKSRGGLACRQPGLFANGDLRYYFENPTIGFFIDRKLPGFNERNQNLNRQTLQRLIEYYKSL